MKKFNKSLILIMVLVIAIFTLTGCSPSKEDYVNRLATKGYNVSTTADELLLAFYNMDEHPSAEIEWVVQGVNDEVKGWVMIVKFKSTDQAKEVYNDIVDDITRENYKYKRDGAVVIQGFEIPFIAATKK